MNKRYILLALAFTAIGTLAGFGLKSVLADGIPTPNPLYYSGTLSEAGQVINDPARSIKVILWTNQTPTTGESALCTTSVTTPVINGRFRVALDSSCQGGINANRNVFVEVVENGTTLLRAKIGAVPYAVEADHAVNATNAGYAIDAGHASTADNATNASGAAGALDARIASIESVLSSKSAFSAYQTRQQSVPTGAGVAVLFDQKDFDLANEFSTVSGFFTSRTGGLYDVNCQVEWAIGAGQPIAYYQTTIWVNQNSNTGLQSGTDNTGHFATIQAHGLVKLSANDTLFCQAFQNTGSAQSTENTATQNNSATRFSAVRLSP